MGTDEGRHVRRLGLKTKLFGLSLLLVGCQQAASPPQSSSTTAPTPAASIASTPTPAETPLASTQNLIALQEVTAKFEVAVDDNKDGYLVAAKLLKGELPKGIEGSVFDISLDNEAEQALFDSKLLPILQESFTKPLFVPNRKLVAGDQEVDFRGLRHLVRLVGQRADQHWAAGDKDKALKLAALPLSLAASMQAHPETVSVNLFSSAYAETTLDLIPLWLESEELKPETAAKLHGVLKSFSPNFGHIQETVAADFALLLNSLDDEEGRGRLGIGLVEDSTLALWKGQLASLFEQATALALPDKSDVEAFNKAFRAAADPIQGTVPPYPEMVTSQKRSFAKYKATELGLALLGPQGSELRKLETEQLLQKVFPEEPTTREMLKASVDVNATESSVTIVGKQHVFSLISPEEGPSLFEYHQGLGDQAQPDS